MKTRITLLLSFILFLTAEVFSQTTTKKTENEQNIAPEIQQALDSLSDDVRHLKMEDDVYTNFFNSIEGVLNSYLMIFSILTVLLLIFQIWVARSEKKMSEELRKSFTESLRDQETNNRRLLDSVIHNIDQTTKFIDSYTNLVGIQKDAASIREKLKEFEDNEDEQRRKKLQTQKEKNGKAMRLIKSAFETSFGSSYFNDYDRAKFNSFFVEMSPHLSTVDSDDETEKNWNADVYFLMGLNQFLSGQSKDAEKYLEKAARRVENFIKSQPENTDALFPERELYAVYGGIDGWSKMLHSKCAFYIGLNHYRLGRFRSAISEFERALQYSPNEIDPQFLRYQSRYWAKAFENFPLSMADMASLAETINADGQKDEKAKKMLLARLYKKIGDFYLPSDIDDRYTAEKNIKKTLEWYEKANDLIQEVNGDLQNTPRGYAQFVPMVYFALGKALKNAGKSGKKSPDELFKETVNLCEQVIPDIQNPETRYILYYTLAYAQHQLGKHREAGFNIALALIELEKFCSNPNYNGYSPINNIMLPSQQLRDELNAFKMKLFSRA